MAHLVETEEETMLRDAARKFLDQNAPVSRLREMRDQGKSADPELWREMAAMGWAGVLVPAENGGSDMGYAAASALAEEMGKTLVSSPFLSTAVMAVTALRRFDGPESAERLSQIAAGRLTYAFAIDETARFNPDAIELTAEKDGNGFRLNGRKQFVVDGAQADRLLVPARTEVGVTLFDIPADRPGVTRDATPMIDSRDSADITFDAVSVTGDEITGDLGQGMTILKPAIEAGQAALAAEMTGLAAGVFGMTVGYLKERTQFGVPIGSFQALQHRAAHLWCECELTASAVLNAARMLDQDPENASMAVSLAKARATATAQLATQEGVQMHGGIGMTDEYDAGFFMKRARVSSEWLGDYGYHAEIIARHRGF